MPLTTGALPTGLRSALLLHWRARDLSTRAASGQAGTLTRPNTQSVFDLAGTAISVGREEPAFAAVDTDGDTIRDTVGLALGNTAEAYWLSFEAVPQAMTFYTKFVPAVTGAGGVVLWRIANAASGVALLDVHTSAANTLVGLHQTAGGSAQTAGLTFAVGEVVETRLVLTSTGAVQLGISRNGGTETVTAATGALALAAAWSDTKLWLGSVNASGSFAAYFLAHKAMTGARQLQELRDAF